MEVSDGGGALEEEALRARLAAAAAGGGAAGFAGEERSQMEAGSLGYTRLSASTRGTSAGGAEVVGSGAAVSPSSLSSGRGAADKGKVDASILAQHISLDGFERAQWADVTVHACGRSWKLHRLVLARSPFFRAMLTGDWAERQNDKDLYLLGSSRVEAATTLSGRGVTPKQQRNEGGDGVDVSAYGWRGTPMQSDGGGMADALPTTTMMPSASPERETHEPSMPDEADPDEAVDADALEEALAYLYGRSPILTTSSAPRILAAACYLQLDELAEMCADFIVNEMTQDTVLAYQCFVDSRDYGRFGEYIRGACWGCLSSTGSTQLHDVLLKLPSKTVCKVLAANELYVENEVERFEFALAVMKARKDILDDLCVAAATTMAATAGGVGSESDEKDCGGSSIVGNEGVGHVESSHTAASLSATTQCVDNADADDGVAEVAEVAARLAGDALCLTPSETAEDGDGMRAGGTHASSSKSGGGGGGGGGGAALPGFDASSFLVDVFSKSMTLERQLEEEAEYMMKLFKSGIFYAFISFADLSRIEEKMKASNVKWLADAPFPKEGLWDQTRLRMKIIQLEYNVASQMRDSVPVDSRDAFSNVRDGGIGSSGSGERELGNSSPSTGVVTDVTATTGLSGRGPAPTPSTNFAPFRFGVSLPDVLDLVDGQSRQSREVYYAGSMWKVSVQAFSDEGPDDDKHRRTLGVFLHRRKAEEGLSLDPSYYVDYRETLFARYKLTIPSNRGIFTFGTLSRRSKVTSLPPPPKGWGWRSALLFDEVPNLLDAHGSIKITAAIQLAF